MMAYVALGKALLYIWCDSWVSSSLLASIPVHAQFKQPTIYQF